MPLPPAARRLALSALAALIALVAVSTAHADDPPPALGGWHAQAADTFERVDAARPEPDLYAWQDDDVAVVDQEMQQAQGVSACTALRFVGVPEGEINLFKTDADLVAESDGSRLCVFYDTRFDALSVLLPVARSGEEFRRTKAQLQPLLPIAGIDPCAIAFWSTPQATIGRQLTLRDRYDAGQACRPLVIGHGPVSDARRGEVEAALEASAATAGQLFGWQQTWPFRAHVYDDQAAFVEGWRAELDDEVDPRTLDGVGGVTTTRLGHGGLGQLINLAGPTGDGELRMLVAHEFMHIVHYSLFNNGDALPFFVDEGGAEYFASLVAGPAQPGLARRYRAAQNEVLSDRVTPLRELVRRPDDARRELTAYSRGYAAMRFLATRWGRDSVARLHLDNVGGSPDRFVRLLSEITGLTLDGFDAELSAHLSREAETTTSVIGRLTIPPRSMLATMATTRPVGRTAEISERFTARDSAMRIHVRFNCPATTISLRAQLIAPGSRPFEGRTGEIGPGCDGGFFEFPLDRAANGVAPRTLPGTWTVELYANGTLAGTITFEIE